MENESECTPEYLELVKALDVEDKHGEREIAGFYQFEEWFPQPSKVAYQVLLSNLIHHFRQKWPKDFRIRQLRQWVDHAVKCYADPKNNDMGDFYNGKIPVDLRGLELPLIFELARNEYADGLQPLEGLAFIADKNTAHGYKSATAHKQRADYQDKQDCQKIAQELWRANPALTIKQLINAHELKAYAIKYKGRHTLGDWLKEIDPRPPEKRRGPKSRT